MEIYIKTYPPWLPPALEMRRCGCILKLACMIAISLLLGILQGSLYYQPKQCTINGKSMEIPQIYHRFALFDAPQIGNVMIPVHPLGWSSIFCFDVGHPWAARTLPSHHPHHWSKVLILPKKYICHDFWLDIFWMEVERFQKGIFCGEVFVLRTALKLKIIYIRFIWFQEILRESFLIKPPFGPIPTFKNYFAIQKSSCGDLPLKSSLKHLWRSDVWDFFHNWARGLPGVCSRVCWNNLRNWISWMFLVYLIHLLWAPRKYSDYNISHM